MVARSAFPHSFFLAMQNTEKPVQDGEGPLGGFNRTVWTQIASYMLVLSSVVVCDWYGDLFGIWLELAREVRT